MDSGFGKGGTSPLPPPPLTAPPPDPLMAIKVLKEQFDIKTISIFVITFLTEGASEIVPPLVWKTEWKNTIQGNLHNKRVL